MKPRATTTRLALLASLLAQVACSQALTDGADGDDARMLLHDAERPDASAPLDAPAASDAPDAFAPDAPPEPDALPDADAQDPDAGVSDAEAGVSAAEYHRRADVALQSLWLRFWNGSRGYFSRYDPDQGDVTGYWIVAQALDATLDGVERTGGRRYAGLIDTIFAAQNAMGWSRNYYDDENWMALALLRAYDLTHRATYLARARALFADIEGAWDTTCCGAHPGGIWWNAAPHTEKATASNAGPVITGARLYEHTHDATLLAFAQRAYDFWLAHMVDPATHEVTDHIDVDGTLNHARFTYNEGLMIGAAVELHRATGQAHYLADAHAIAGFMIAHETTPGPEGRVLFDCTNATCGQDDQQFKGIGFRYLAELLAEDPAGSPPAYAAVLAASANTLWDHARDRATGRFAPDWAEPAPARPELVDADISAVMALEVWARMQGAYTGALPATGTLEAEEASLHGVGLEARYAGFSGWGYVDAWNADGQWVDFAIDAPSGGSYTLTFRYAAGGPDASREVVVDGRAVEGNLAFRSSGAWDRYATVSTAVSLTAGAHTIGLVYSSAAGSHGYVNLDRLVVAPAR